jgi:hypothetical protein
MRSPKGRIETVVPQFGNQGTTGVLSQAYPSLSEGLSTFPKCGLVATSCLRSGSPLPKMDQARASRASLVVLVQEAYRVELEGVELGPFLAGRPPKRA